MNERIKELAKLAGIVIIPNSRPISIMGLTTDLEKFAELIVRECSAPPQRPWVGLTDVELAAFSDEMLGSYDLCLEVEAHLRSKNT